MNNSSSRKLIITADDFGAAVNINEGILEAVKMGLIKEISVLSNFKGNIPDLQFISENYPDVGIGVHLNIEADKPLLDIEKVSSLVDDQGYFYTLKNILNHVHDMSVEEVRMELTAQVEELVKNGIQIDHLTDHGGIIALYTPFAEIMFDLAREYNLAVRSTILASSKFPENYPKSAMRKKGIAMLCRLAMRSPCKAISLLKYCSKKEMSRKSTVMDQKGIPHTDYLIECFWGNPSFEYFEQIIKTLPPGTTEFIMHLGNDKRIKPFPRGIDNKLFDSRELELEIICSPRAKEIIEQNNIKLIGFSDLFPD